MIIKLIQNTEDWKDTRDMFEYWNWEIRDWKAVYTTIWTFKKSVGPDPINFFAEAILPNSSSSMLEIEISGVLSSSSRTTLSKLCPVQRPLIPDFFFKVSRYSSSSFADVSSPMILLFRVECADELCETRLAFWAESFHFALFEDIFAYQSLDAENFGIFSSLQVRKTFQRPEIRTKKTNQSIINRKCSAHCRKRVEGRSGYQVNNNSTILWELKTLKLKIESVQNAKVKLADKALHSVWSVLLISTELQSFAARARVVQRTATSPWSLWFASKTGQNNFWFHVFSNS